jgi:hypothetical protein
MLPPIVVTTPLPPADLVFGAMRCAEGLSVLGEMDVSLLSRSPISSPRTCSARPSR